MSNPFQQNKVTEPRQIEEPVPGLNDDVYEKLCGELNSLLGEMQAGRVAGGRCLLLTSSQPGYGKSYMIGRLFRAFRSKATLIYVRPFETEDSYWDSLLHSIVYEMEYPDGAETMYCRPGEMSQLEAFGHGVLSKLFGATLDRLEDGRKRAKFIKALFESFPAMAERLQQRVHLEARPKSWLSVLFHLCLGDDPERKETARAWLHGESISPQEATALGIAAGDRPREDATITDRNEWAKRRICDFCRLALFYRPFAFFFDQTELYGVRPQLARCFGVVVSELAERAPNHIAVIAANLYPWKESISAHWEEAQSQRVQRPYLKLRGITVEQAKALVQSRLADWENDEDLKQRFEQQHWISSQFVDQPQLGVRQFLTGCSLRWHSLAEGATAVDAQPAGLAGARLKEAYVTAQRQLEAEPKRLGFDANVLLWCARDLAEGLPNLTIQSLTTRRGYFRLLWSRQDRRVRIGMEGGCHHLRWRAIAESDAQGEAGGHLHCEDLQLRTSDLPVIPKPGWAHVGEQVRQAQDARRLRIWAIPRDLVVRIYAAHKLFADVVEGDLQADRKTVLDFLRGELDDFWTGILEPIQDRPEPPAPRQLDVSPAAVERVVAIVREKRFLSLDDLCAQVGSVGFSMTRDQVLVALNHEANVRLHPGPKVTVVQWLTR